MRLFYDVRLYVLTATSTLLMLLLLACTPESKLDVVLDVSEGIDDLNLNIARKDVLKYLRVTARYADGIPETRVADFDPTKPFPLGSFPFGTVHKVEVRGYGIDGSMIAYGERNVDRYLGESGLSVTVPFRYMLTYIPIIATNMKMAITDPFNGLNITTDQEAPIKPLSISGDTSKVLIPQSDAIITAVAISPSGEYGVAAVSLREKLRDYLSDGTQDSSELQWLVLFSTKDHVVHVPAYSVQVKTYAIDRLVFSDDGNYVAFSTVPTLSAGTKTVQVGVFSAQYLISRDSQNPMTLTHMEVQPISINGMGVVRDLIVKKNELVVLGNDRDFVSDGSNDLPFLGTANPTRIKTVCDLYNGDGSRPFNTLIARIKFSERNGLITTTPRIYMAHDSNNAARKDFDLGVINIVPYFTSMVWIEETNSYLAVQPCSNLHYWNLTFDDEADKVKGTVISSSDNNNNNNNNNNVNVLEHPFRLVYKDKKLFVIYALEYTRDQIPYLTISRLDPGSCKSEQNFLIAYPTGGISINTTNTSPDNASVRVSIFPQVVYPTDFQISMDYKRYVVMTRGYYLGRNIEVDLNGTTAILPNFFYVSSRMVIGESESSDPIRILRIYCHGMTITGNVHYCEELPGIRNIFEENKTPPFSYGYPASSFGFIYGGR